MDWLTDPRHSQIRAGFFVCEQSAQILWTNLPSFTKLAFHRYYQIMRSCVHIIQLKSLIVL